MIELDKQAVAAWRKRYPLDANFTDEEILCIFGNSLSFCFMRLGCATDNFMDAVMKTWPFSLLQR